MATEALPLDGKRKLAITTDPAGVMPVEGIGRTGLRQWSGRIDEEFLTELKGDRKYQVYREMAENDPIVGAVLRAIEYLIRGVEWRIQPQDQTDAAQVELADQLWDALNGMRRPWPELLAEILSFLPYGWSFHEVLYQAGPDGIGWADWPIRAQETLLKWQFQKDAAGKDTDELMGLTQQVPTDATQRTIPLSKGLLFRLESHKNNPEGRSILRNAYLPWYYKNHLQRIEAIGIERDLAGYPVLYVPGEVLENTGGTSYTAAQKIVTNIRRDEQEGALLSSARDQEGNLLWELKLLSTGGQRSFDTNAILQRYDQRIAMSCLADFVLLGHEKVGSFALASSKTDVFALALKAILDTICSIINRQAIPALAELNGWPTEDLPELVHSDIEIPDLQEIGAYITALAGAGVPLFPDQKLENRLREMAGLPVLSPEEYDQREAIVEADKQAQLDAMTTKAPPPNALVDDPPPVQKGRWITTDSGAHVYLEEGQNVGEALADGSAGPREGTSGPQQKASARHYQSTGYKAVNAALRGHGEPTARTKAITQDLDSALQASRLKEDTTVYRGMRSGELSQLRRGSVISDKGFVSTSIDRRVAVTFAGGVYDAKERAVMEIHVRRGSRAVRMGDLTGNDAQGEVLLPRGSRFRVRSIRRSSRGYQVTVDAL